MAKKKVAQERKNGGSKKKDQYTVVLEDLRAQFRVFGEALGYVSDTLDQHTVQLQEIAERLTRAEAELKLVTERLTRAEAELEFIKEQLAIIRHNQVTRDEFRLLETRVVRLERARPK